VVDACAYIAGAEIVDAVVGEGAGCAAVVQDAEYVVGVGEWDAWAKDPADGLR
jgi:hypothetical protein